MVRPSDAAPPRMAGRAPKAPGPRPRRTGRPSTPYTRARTHARRGVWRRLGVDRARAGSFGAPLDGRRQRGRPPVDVEPGGVVDHAAERSTQQAAQALL